MKQITIIIIWASLIVTNAYTQSGNGHNYIITRTPTEQIGKEKVHTLSSENSRIEVQYYDAFGRPEMTVSQQVTPTRSDLVSITEFDAAGREFRQWLPIPASGNPGAFRNPDEFKRGSSGYYQDAFAYSETGYEPSTLNRPIQNIGPGEEWHTKNKSVKTEYLTNTQTGELAVKRFLVDPATDILQGGELYPSGRLQVVRTEDEDGHVRYEFTDFEGQTVLSRVIGTEGNLDTYSIYDDYGNLKTVLPPLAADDKTSIGKKISEIPYAYYYRYDDCHRIIEKKIPDCEPVYYVYDKAGKLIYTQDGEQRKTNQWSFNAYDAVGRTILSGKTVLPATHEFLIRYCSTLIFTGKYIGNEGENLFGYRLSLFPGNNKTVLQANYYDTYDYQNLPQFSNKRFDFTSTPEVSNYREDCREMLTGKFTASIDEPGKGEYSAYYYDVLGQQIQEYHTYTMNNIFNYIRTTTSYNFSKQPVKKYTQTDIYPFLSETYRYIYDHAGRLTDTYHQYENRSEALLSRNEYDENGRLALKTHYNNTDTIGYKYNIRGWTSEISSKMFKQKLYYTEKTEGKNDGYYNGNITGMEINQNGHEYTQSYSYDNSDRLKMVRNIYTPSTIITTFAETFSYDKMGNITQLVRCNANKKHTLLKMSYKGNQIQSITNSGVDVPSDDEPGLLYPDEVASEKEYFYDANGNMCANLDYGIMTIRYNLLNLPDTVQMKNGNQIMNYYLADGRKYKTVSKTFYTPLVIPLDSIANSNDPHNITTEEQYRHFYFLDGKLERVNTPEGYISYTPVGIDNRHERDYFFFTHDHLGNVRVAQNYNYWVRNQSTEYYTSGNLYGRSANPELQPYKFGGKELITMHGIDWYDFNARMYSPVLMRFMSIDPMAEKYYGISPYAYCANNPIRNIDLRGDSITVLNLGSGTNQHMGMLIQNNTGKWQYYSVNGDNVNSSGSHTGGREFNDIAVGKFDSPQQFMDSQYNIKGDKNDKEGSNKYGYTEGYTLPTTPEQDKVIAETFKYISANEEYGIISNNCATAVQKSLGAVGIDTEQKLRIPANKSLGESGYTIRLKPFVPSIAFKIIIRNNPQGIYITKTK
ncbi:DUF6443 domain-containing protein [Coprobacter sp.]